MRRIIKELKAEKIIQNDAKLVIGAVILLGEIFVGDILNNLYKLNIIEVGERDSGDFRCEIFDRRKVSLEVKAIEFRGRNLNRISSGYSAQIELSGDGTEFIEPPEDVLGMLEGH